jgi:putative hydrolase of the HAD superfamily
MPRAVLFDAGGTLIHMDRRFVLQALNANGIAADLAALMNAEALARAEVRLILRSDQPGTDASRWSAYAAALMRALHCEGEPLARVRAALWERHQTGQLWTSVEDGTPGLLDELRQSGYRTGVVSNADGRVAMAIEHAGLAPYLDVIVDSGVFGIEKPDPRIFLHACERLGVEPGNAMFVGDVYEIDVVGARNAGLSPVLISGDDQLEWDCPVVRALAELPELLAIQADPLAC